MSLRKELLKILDDDDEPLSKRIKIADNAFNSSELLLQHKEAFFLVWLLKAENLDDIDRWNLLNKWLRSELFKEINRNDIDNEEICDIIELIMKKIFTTKSNCTRKAVLESSILIIENKTFQQYFRYNISAYSQFVSCLLNNVQCLEDFRNFLKSIFCRSVVAEDGFYKSFLDIIFPTLVSSINKFQDNAIFQEISGIIQKCIFYKHQNNFKMFINCFFEEKKIDKQIVAKAIFKCLLGAYKEDIETGKIKYKLLLHAFCTAYSADFELIFKFFILLIHILGFDLNNKFIFHKVSRLEISGDELSLTKSLQIILDLFNIMSGHKNDLDLKVKDVTFTEFIRTILRQILCFNAPSKTCYNIFIKSIEIDPLVIQPITDSILIYAMMANNSNRKEEYETLVITIFDVYSKLHRIENMIAKMVQILHDTMSGQMRLLEDIYDFRGFTDVDKSALEEKNFEVEDVISDNILQCFTRCICSLASWQVINIFKTLIYYLDKVLNYIDNIKNGKIRYFIFLEILSRLISTFLSSIRIAEHTVALNVVEKAIKNLEELRHLLKQFGTVVVHREHNHMLMRSFLNVSYNWAEIYMNLEYYSINNKVVLKKSVNNDVTSCNITYLHSYLTVKQWCLLSERITNFGEPPCKLLLQKLYIQRLRAMLLFEKNISDDIVSNIIRSITVHLENNWMDILQDKFIVNNLLCKMDSTTILSLVESLLNDKNFENIYKQKQILNSSLILSAANFVAIGKINKMICKQKRKLNEDFLRKTISTKICSLFNESLFLYGEDHQEIMVKARSLYVLAVDNNNFEWKFNEDKVNYYFEILHKFPVIFSSEIAQKIYLLYFFAFHKDLSSEFTKGNYKKLQSNCETLIIGILQHCKFKLIDIFEVDVICIEITTNFEDWEQVFSLLIENIFRCENSIKLMEPVVSIFTENLLNPTYMRCIIIILNAINKLKKRKMSKEVKSLGEKYKITICDKILEFVTENKQMSFLVTGYAWVLKYFLLQNKEEKLIKLLVNLSSYVEAALGNKENFEYEGCLMLFLTVLQNKSKIKLANDDFINKIWTFCKENEEFCSKFGEYSHLVTIIFGHISNEKFTEMTTDLLTITENSVKVEDYVLFGRYVKIWESLFSCNLNPRKTENLQNVLGNLLKDFTSLLQNTFYNELLFQNIFVIEKGIIQTTHLLLTPTMIDNCILSVTLLMNNENYDFLMVFNLSVSILELLLKYRKPVIMDRLPPYLQQYRILLRSLCKRSNSDLNLDELYVKNVANFAHLLEKLTKNLVTSQKDMARISMYLIADILEQYEQITLYPNVKIHLNNCIYSLIGICDQHAIAYLLRVLTSASTEMFKVMYDDYKKYYRFTGKV